jgi:hypothetical protein
MGNLFENSFKEIWVSKRWNDFRQNLHEKCHLCPQWTNDNVDIWYPKEGKKDNKLLDIDL